jgi:hypothetical protein
MNSDTKTTETTDDFDAFTCPRCEHLIQSQKDISKGLFCAECDAQVICRDCGWEITGMVWGKGVCYDCHDTWTCACLCDERCDCE